MTTLRELGPELGTVEIVDALVDRAATEEGKARAGAVTPATRREEAERLLAETAAMSDLLDRRADFDVPPFPIVEPRLRRAAKGTDLTGEELRGFVPLLMGAEAVARLFAEEGIGEGNLLALPLPVPHGLGDLLDESIDESGTVRDDATPEIERLTRAVNALKRGLRERAEEMRRDPAVAGMLMDDYVTLRDNRFVLPVRAEHKHQLSGITHGASATGQTFYVEPQALVEMNNRLRTAEVEREREIARLLAELTAMVAAEIDPIRTVVESMATLDLVLARARLGRDLGGSLPAFGGHIDLKGSANPLMLLEGKPAVRNDVAIPEGTAVTIISGPNAGGKTVTLKSVGLASLMARCGLFVAAREGSTVPFFTAVHADIGDAQSIHDGLSTFSAHLARINAILADAAPGSLVLLDELMVSTDPREGSALAVAVLDRLRDAGATVAVTTHFHDLKLLAQAHERFYNVSMEFDPLEGGPTYRLIPGAPGASSALEIALRHGMDPAIIAAARTRLEGGDERIVQALADLRNERILLRRAREEAEADRGEAARLKTEVESLRGELAEERAEQRRTAKRKIGDEVAAARGEVARLMEEARQAGKDRKKLEAVREEVVRIGDAAVRASAPKPAIAAERLRQGDTVHVVPLDRKGKIESLDGDRAEVSFGSMRVTVARSELVGLGRGGAPGGGQGALARGFPKQRFPAGAPPEDFGGGKQKVSVEAPPIPAPPGRFDRPAGEVRELQLRGLRVEEGLDALDRFLDEAVRNGVEEVRIVHGKGTGAMRAAVRETLATLPYVAAQRPGEPNEGGDGVTIAELTP